MRIEKINCIIDKQTNFKAGFTNKMKAEALSCDVTKISAELHRNGIYSDFKDNKIVAWSVLKSVNIIKEINSRYKLNLGLPDCIFVEDFNNFDFVDNKTYAFCNFLPAKLFQNSNKITPGKSVFINQFKEYSYKNGNIFWENIDSMASLAYYEKNAPTDFFLDVFFHEFGHIMHECNMIDKLGAVAAAEVLVKLLNSTAIDSYKKNYINLTSKICDYAGHSPNETIACDISKRIVNHLDKNNLCPNSNFVKNSPYTTNKIGLQLSRFCNPLNKLLKSIWDGNFKIPQGQQSP